MFCRFTVVPGKDLGWALQIVLIKWLVTAYGRPLLFIIRMGLRLVLFMTRWATGGKRARRLKFLA